MALFLLGAAKPQPPAGWKFSLEQGRSVPSTITAQNRCLASHSFRFVAGEGLGFVRFLEPVDSLTVPPRGKRTVGIEFSAAGLDPGVYSGQIQLICLDCGREPGCTQDVELVHVEMTVTAPSGPGVTVASPERLGCTCTLTKPAPAFVCKGDPLELSVQYEGKGTDKVVTVEALIERKGEKDFAKVGADELKTNPYSDPKWPCNATKPYKIKPPLTKPGHYKVTFSASCAKDKVEHEFDLVELVGVRGPGKLFLRKDAKPKEVSGEWQADLLPAGVKGDFLKWEITSTAKDPLPTPSKGAGSVAKATFGKTGKYKITFRCGGQSKSLDFEVVEVEATITGPAILCFPLDGDARCADLKRVQPKGERLLAMKPEDPNVSWRVEMYVKGGLKEIAKGGGPVAKAVLPQPACYRVSFWSSEGLIVAKEVLAYRMDIDVVVDNDLTTATASPAEVPIYIERKGAVCYQLTLQQCRAFPMRDRVLTEPTIPVEIQPRGGVALAWDTDEKDGSNSFTGQYKGPLQCEPDTVRDDFFTLTANGDGRVDFTVKNPRTGETEKGALIQVSAAKPLKDILLVEGRNTVIKPMVQGERVQTRVYYTKDSAGHASELWNGANDAAVQIDKMFHTANTYWSQCGVCFQPVIKGNLPLAFDLGADVDASETTKIADAVKAVEGFPRAEVHFVHKVAGFQGFTESHAGPGVPAFDTSFGNPEGKGLNGATLGHELLHGIAGLPGSHKDQQQCDLGVAVAKSYADGLISPAQCKTAQQAVERTLYIVTEADLGKVKQGQAIAAITFRALGGVPPLTWSLTEESSLPEGLTLDAGTLSGKPAKSGRSSFTIKVKDAEGQEQTRRFRIEVQP